MTTFFQLARSFFRFSATVDELVFTPPETVSRRVDPLAEYTRLYAIQVKNYGGVSADFNEHWQANPASGNPEFDK